MWWEILDKLEPPPKNARGELVCSGECLYGCNDEAAPDYKKLTNCCYAGICARQGFEYATGIYHYAMALALAASSETAAYGKLPGAEESLEQAEGHLQELKVWIIMLVSSIQAICVLCFTCLGAVVLLADQEHRYLSANAEDHLFDIQISISCAFRQLQASCSRMAAPGLEQVADCTAANTNNWQKYR